MTANRILLVLAFIGLCTVFVICMWIAGCGVRWIVERRDRRVRGSTANLVNLMELRRRAEERSR